MVAILYPFCSNILRNSFGSVPCNLREFGVNSKNMKGIWYLDINSIPLSIAFPSAPSTSILIKHKFFSDKKDT